MMRTYWGLGRRRKRARFPRLNKFKRFVLILFLVLILGSYGMFTLADNLIIPAIIAIADQQSIVEINNVINQGLNDMIQNFELSSQDFFEYTLDANGRISNLMVNTLLVNQIAASLAVDISRELATEEAITVYVPSGVFTGIRLFYGMGPGFGVPIIPVGEAKVQYETSFTSAGINQVNFQVWLEIDAQMRIMVPLQEQIVHVNRRIALVNTIFAGEVPPHMLLGDW